MATKTNLAYNYELFEEGAARRQTALPAAPEIKIKQTKAKSRVHVFESVKTIFYLMVVVAALFLFIYARVVQTELNSEYNETLQALNVVKGENARLQVMIEEQLNNDSIAQIAKEQLNMQALDESQTEYIEFNNQAKCYVIDEQSTFEKIKSWFASLL